ncbi:MAG: DUF4288 domain-containing protein [Planctomycetes bacterium]|nr:DUF4288 domain-containing protein [Planctomycetota bacterium]
MKSENPVRWFVCTLKTNCYVGDELRDSVDYSLRLIKATSEESARSIAEGYANEGETEYLNSDGEVVRWVFDCVEEVVEFSDGEELESGAEVATWVQQRKVKS